MNQVRIKKGWGAFYRRGGVLARFFDTYEQAKAYCGTGHTMRAARCEVREIIPRKRAAKAKGKR